MSNPAEFRLSDSERWTAGAACTGMELLMFPGDADHAAIAAAKATCAVCPIRQQCLDVALDNGENFGIWGGTTADERRAWKRKSARVRASNVVSPVGENTTDPYRRPLVG